MLIHWNNSFLSIQYSTGQVALCLQVVMLRSVGDLLRYIDENHLTSDFTAKVEYCQSDWIVLRTVNTSDASQSSRAQYAADEYIKKLKPR